MYRVIGSAEYLKKIKAKIETKNSWGKNELITMLHEEHLEYISTLDKVDENISLKSTYEYFPDNEINKSDEMGNDFFTEHSFQHYETEDDLPF